MTSMMRNLVRRSDRPTTRVLFAAALTLATLLSAASMVPRNGAEPTPVTVTSRAP